MIARPALALLAATSLLAPAGELQDAGKKLTAAHQDAIVWLSVISKISMSTDGDAPAQVKAALAAQGDKEEKSEALGTIVDPSGLIVAALGTIDKSSIVDGQTVNTPMGAIKLKSSSEIKEVKVITADGSEIPADLVMKDEDLGLAFIKVRADSDEAKGVEFKAIDLNDSAKGQLLDECIGLGRMDDSLNREPSAVSTEISGVTTRPRTFYRVNTDGIGCPVFLASGKLLGISVVRKGKGGSGEGQIKAIQIVLPAADIAKVAVQAKDAKPAPKPAPKADDKKAEEKQADDKKAEEPKKEDTEEKAEE